MQPTYPSVQQPPPVYPPASPAPPPQPVHAPAATRTPSTTDDLKAVAKGVAGVARLVGKSAAALGTAAVKAGAASASASSASAHHVQASHHPSAPPRYGQAAAPYAAHTVAPPAPAMFRAAPAFAAAPVPHAPPRREKERGTCWCGFRDDPEMAPCARAAAKAALFPLAAAAYPLGAALWAALQAHYCVFSCCMVHHVHAAAQTAARGGVRLAAAGTRDVVDCWQCQAEAWVWLDNANGNCWVCELPVSKRVLRGHIVEAPCQLCLWGSER